MTGDRERVGHRLAGQRAAEDRPVAGRPRREDDQGDDTGQADEADPFGRGRRRDPPGDDDPDEGQPGRLVAGQRGQAQAHAQGDDPRVGQAPATRVGPDAAHQQAGDQRERREGHRRIGQGRVQDEGQVDRAGQPRADGQGPGALHAEATLGGDVRGQPPAQDRHDRPDQDAGDLGGAEGRPEGGHRRGGEPGREGHPDLEGRAWEDEGRRAVAPQGIADQPTALEQVLGDPDVIRGVLRLGEHDLGREDDPDDEGHGEDQEGGQDRLATAHEPSSTG